MLMATCLIAAGPPMAPLNSSKTITVGTASHSQPIVITPATAAHGHAALPKVRSQGDQCGDQFGGHVHQSDAQ